MFEDSYKIALHLEKIYGRKYPGIDVGWIAVEVAIKYKDYIPRPGASLHTCMSRALHGLLVNEVRRLQRVRPDTDALALVSRKEVKLRFHNLSTMAKLLLKHLMIAGKSSQHECYQELHKKGWTFEMFKKYIKELRNAYDDQP